MKKMSSRQILDAIRRGVEESARLVAERKLQRVTQPPIPEQAARSIGEMTPREILEAIGRGLEETSLRFVGERPAYPASLPAAEE